jgi:hypothetical protein
VYLAHDTHLTQKASSSFPSGNGKEGRVWVKVGTMELCLCLTLRMIPRWCQDGPLLYLLFPTWHIFLLLKIAFGKVPVPCGTV